MHFRDNQLAYHHQVHAFLENNDYVGLSQFLLEKTEFLTPTGLTQNPMLHLACRYASNEMAKILHEQLGKDARILAKRTVAEGWTPLHLAAVYGGAELMQTLMGILGEEAPATIAIALNDETKATALHLAMSEGKTPVVDVLLKGCGEQVVDIVSMLLAEEWNALHLAVHCGDPEMLTAIIHALGKENARAMAQVYVKSGMNILHLTALSGDPDITDIILDLIPDNMLCELGQVRIGILDNATPLNLAVQYGLTNLVKHLLNAFGELASLLCQKKMANSWNAFIQVAYFGNVEMLQAMIVVLGADAEKQIMQPFMQMRDATPFHMVLNRGNVAMTKAMIAAVDKKNHYALINSSQTDGTRPVNLAKRFNNDDLLNVLLETGVMVA